MLQIMAGNFALKFIINSIDGLKREPHGLGTLDSGFESHSNVCPRLSVLCCPGVDK